MTQRLHIEPTDNCPEFNLDPDGILKIKGRGLFGPGTDTGQMTRWIESYLKNPAESTLVIIAFEYLNSYSTTVLVNILKKLSDALLNKGKLKIQWFYEDDDDDIQERGEYISLTLKIPVTFIVTNDIKTCC